MPIKLVENRRRFVGGSDARIIMRDDEAALVRLSQEKRGKAEFEDLSGISLSSLVWPLSRLIGAGMRQTPGGSSPTSSGT